MKNEKTLVKNSIFYTASTLICMVIPLAIYPYITRVLGPENYGKFSFAQNLVTYFTILSTLGLRQYAQRMCSSRKDEQEMSKIVKSLLTISGSLTLLAVVIYAAVVYFLRVATGEAWVYVAFGGMIVFSSLGLDWLIEATECFAFASVRNTVTRLLLPICALWLVTQKSDYAVYALVYTACYSILPAVMNYVHLSRKRLISFRGLCHSEVEVREHLGPIFFLALVTIGSKIFSGMDVMMLRFMRDDTTVGLYTNAIKLPLVMDELLMAVAAVITPRLYAAVREERPDEAKSLIHYASNTMFFFAVPALLTFTFFSKELVLLIAGSEYVSGHPILIVYSFIMFTTLCLTLGGTRMFIAKGKEKQLFAILLMAGGFNAFLNYLLIPVWGGLGAAVASILANVCMFIVEATYIRSWGLIFDRDKFKYLVAGVVLAGLFVCVKQLPLTIGAFPMVALAVVVGGVCYVLVLALVREPTVVRMFAAVKGLPAKLCKKK
ncbi:MAG: flippase [Clostridia bacterium]|nr:flippase [Clostridia bacterium]